VTCQACFNNSTVSLDDYIQVTFTLSGRVRENVYRRPTTLPVDDYFFKYSMTRGAMVGGTSFEGIMRGFSRLLTYVPAHTTIRAEMEAHPSVFQLADFTKKPLVTFMVSDETTDQIQTIQVRVIDGQYVSVSHPVIPAEAMTGPFLHKPPQAAFIAQGRVLVEIENCMDEPTPLWIFNLPFDTSAGTTHLEFEPFLSGKKLITTQTFRDLFRSETIQTDEGIGVQDITFLFTDLKGSTAMYDRIGDAQAYYLVRQHFDTLGRVIAHNGGAIVKTIGDAVMATFVNPVDAVKAASEMLTEIEAFNKEITEDIILKIGIHRGHSIVVTLNERLDYFGQTVNIAARVQGLADANEIYITDPIYASLSDMGTLSKYDATPEEVVVKGVSGTLQVYKIRAAT
jgi:class 3 adenylate cyclase